MTSILSSPFLSLTIIDSLLSPSSGPPPTGERRVQLLSAKVHLLSKALSEQYSRYTNTQRQSQSSLRTSAESSTATGTGTGTKGCRPAHSLSVQQQEQEGEGLTESGPWTDTETATALRDGRGSGFEREKKELQIMRVRAELGAAYLSLSIPDVRTAESELGIVERDSGGMIKRLCRYINGNRNRNGEEEEGGEVRSSTDADSRAVERDEDRERERLVIDLKALRRDVLRMMVDVEERLGRQARAERWRKVLAAEEP